MQFGNVRHVYSYRRKSYLSITIEENKNRVVTSVLYTKYENLKV